MHDDGRSPAPPPTQTPDRPQTPSAAESRRREVNRYIRILVVLLAGAALTANLALPGKVAAPVLGAAAVVFGIISLVKLIRYRLSAVLKMSVTIGLVISALLTLGTGAMVAVWPITQTYETCMSQALTQRAQAACTNGYEQTLKDLQQNLGG